MSENPNHIDPINPAPSDSSGFSAETPVADQVEKKKLSWIGFSLVAFALVIFYIYNQMHAIKALRKKDGLNKEVKELKAEYISIQKDLREKSKQSEITKKLEPTGVKELTKPPIKLEIKKPEK